MERATLEEQRQYFLDDAAYYKEIMEKSGLSTENIVTPPKGVHPSTVKENPKYSPYFYLQAMKHVKELSQQLEDFE